MKWPWRYLQIIGTRISGTNDAEIRVHVGPTKWGPWGIIPVLSEDVEQAHGIGAMIQKHLELCSYGYEGIIVVRSSKNSKNRSE